MTAIWPNNIPQCFSTPSYKGKGPDNVLRSQPTIGPAKTRRKTTANVRPLSGEMQMTLTELQILETFIANEIGDGAKTFYFPNQAGVGMQLVRMMQPIETGRLGALWSVTLSLEVLP